MATNADLSSLPTGVLVGLGVVLLLEVALDVFALVDLIRRPVALVAFGNKWIWAALILLVTVIGAVLYLAVGRKPTPAVEQQVAAPKRSSAEIAEALYGNDDKPTTP